ncbi:MAG: DoxX family membrane protein [Proteobacteria bacterium]|nr:DoxX family membrane protein [Pseudomonadota bacterium]
MPIIRFLLKIYTGGLRLFHKFVPVLDLGIRLWLFKAFFFSGLLKTKDWHSTVFLFENEYHVPIIPAEIAAILGTSFELVLPCLLLLGLCSRVNACLLFLFNIAIVGCYPYLWTPDGLNGLYQHITWGLLIAVVMVYGPSQLSLDYLIKKKFSGYEY